MHYAIGLDITMFFLALIELQASYKELLQTYSDQTMKQTYMEKNKNKEHTQQRFSWHEIQSSQCHHWLELPERNKHQCIMSVISVSMRNIT